MRISITIDIYPSDEKKVMAADDLLHLLYEVAKYPECAPAIREVIKRHKEVSDE